VKDLEGIQVALIFGSFAEGEIDAGSDLDLMLIGNPDVAQVTQVIDDLEGRLAREVNYTVFTRDEWDSRLEGEDPFATDVRDAPKVMLVGSEDDL
jgi:predicted nucleotidyltransferase